VTAGRASPEKVYERVCKSTVLILVQVMSGRQMGIAQGSGTLIDKTNRLVLTNDHVVGRSSDIAVFFQAFDKGKRIGEIGYFMDQVSKRKDDVIQAKVVYTDKRVDLALIQLSRLPADAQALPIADRSPKVTNSVLSVGHPKGIAGGGLWVHTAGEIRQFQAGRKWRAGDATHVTDHQADVILTNSQTNPGDSGGPLVNMRAQLVGVTQGGVRDANALSIFIDLPEVRNVIKNYETKSRVKLVLETQSGVAGDTASLPKLLADLDSKDAQVRIKAALALGEMGPDAQRAIPSLFKALKDRDENVARQALQALRAIGTPTRDDVEMLMGGLRDDSPRVRGYSLEALSKLGPEARPAVPKLAELLKAKETDAEMRQQAARCLGLIGPAAATQGVPVLSEALKDPEAALREVAAESLGKFGVQARSAVPSLLALVEDKETTVRRAALSALAQIGPEAKDALPKLKSAFKDIDVEIRRGALAVLGRLGADAVKDKEALAALKAGLDDRALSNNALAALARIGPPAKELAKGLGGLVRDETTRLDAVAALGSVLGKAKLVGVEAKSFKPVLDELINLFELRDENLHTKAIEALGKIGYAAVTPLFQALQKAVVNDLPNTRLGIARALAAIGPAAKRNDVILLLRQISQRDRIAVIRDAADKALQKIQ
jgi:HEAT repeat protein